jgi:hypothetical protein
MTKKIKKNSPKVTRERFTGPDGSPNSGGSRSPGLHPFRAREAQGKETREEETHEVQEKETREKEKEKGKKRDLTRPRPEAQRIYLLIRINRIIRFNRNKR